MTPQPIEAPPPVPKQMSEGGRLAGIFFSPKQAFADIVLRPRWWIPMILLGIMSTIVVGAFSKHVGWDRMIRTTMERNPRLDQMTPAQREQAIQLTVRITSIASYAAGLTSAIAIVIISAIFLFMFNTLMSADIRFPSMMGIVGYSYLPQLLAGALTLVVMFVKDPEDFDLQRPLAFNLGAFLPADLPRWQLALAGSFDLFTFWTISLMAIGISTGARKISFGKAFVAILFPWAIIVILRTMQAVLQG